MQLDQWQKDVLAWNKEKDPTQRNLLICSPRQMGKSTVISEDAGDYAMNNPKKSIMIIAAVDRQSLLLFEKVLNYIFNKDPYFNPEKKKSKHKYICSGKDKPTKHELKLTNGSIIRCLPTGDDGFGIRGYTVDRLYADEAAFIKEEVWAAVTPMLATTGGSIILLSTPFGINNYFFRMFHNKKFKRIQVDPEVVIAGREEPQRTNLIEFRKDEKERMTKLQYQQEHMGLFVGGIQRFFPDELIEKCLGTSIHTDLIGDKFLGVDIARMGGDDTVLVSVDRIMRKKLKMFNIDISSHTYLTETTRLILKYDQTHNYKKIYIDDGGLGVGVFDPLLEHPQTKRKVVAINNASRDIDKITKPRIIGRQMKYKPTPPRKKPLMKEQLYNNLKNLMENGNIELMDTQELKQSLRSIQYENEDGVLKIYGNYSHIAEALIRAAWCVKDKSLNIYVY